jgi:hypothetical protein
MRRDADNRISHYYNTLRGLLFAIPRPAPEPAAQVRTNFLREEAILPPRYFTSAISAGSELKPGVKDGMGSIATVSLDGQIIESRFLPE